MTPPIPKKIAISKMHAFLIWLYQGKEGEGRRKACIWIKGEAYASSLILGEGVNC